MKINEINEQQKVAHQKYGTCEVAEVAKGWVKIADGEGNVHNVRAKEIEIAVEADETDEEEELTLGQRMARHIRPYRDRYTKAQAYSGNASAHNGDGIAQLLASCTPEEAIKTAEQALGIPGQLQAKYEHLNPGQQRMNAGNRIRAALKRGEIEPDDVAKALSSI